MAKFYPPQKLVFNFLPTPDLVEWDLDDLRVRYYPYAAAPAKYLAEDNIRKKWEEENRRIAKGHADKLKAIMRVVEQSRKAGCKIVEEMHQPTCIDWDSCTSGMAEVPTKNCGPLMRRITITDEK